ncbi:MAG: GGDEF domain-containing protein [Pseudomonadota bacterium]
MSAVHSQPAPLSQPGTLARSAAAPRPAGGGRISLTIARIEPWVSWSLSAYTAWVALLSFPDLPALWLFVLYAGVLGKWCHLFPSRRQGRMFLHGALLICAAYLLHTHIDNRLGGPGGPFFFWTAIPVLTYAFMLKPRWGMALVALAVVEFALSSAVRGDAGAADIAQAGFLLVFPLVLFMPLGEAMRKPDEQLEQSRLDRTTGLLNKEGLMIHGDVLLRECRREKRAATVAVFGCDDLLAVREMFGRKAGHKSLALLVERLKAIAGSRGLVARTGPAEFTVMMPGLNRDKALQAIARHLGNPLRVELVVNGEEVVMAPVLVIDTVGTAEATIDGVHADLCADLREIQEAARSGAAGQPLPPETTLSADAATVVVPGNLPPGAFVSHLPETMPVALGAR